MLKYKLSIGEIDQIMALLKDLAIRYDSSENPDFLKYANLHSHDLPITLKRFLHNFKIEEKYGACVISGFPIDDESIGNTPAHWSERTKTSPTLIHEFYLVILATLLGEPFGWGTQQNGYIVHNLLPIKGHEQEQLGSGSETLLWWHTEDAFHPYRPDYLGLFCLRNPDKVQTTYASMELLNLSSNDINILFQPRFIIRPDESHLQKNNFINGNKDFARIEAMNESPEKVPVFFGDPKSPYMKLDPYFMDPLDDDTEAKQALEALIQEIDRNLTDIVLTPGDLIFIDNYKAVHGRKPFYAKYNGKDRWLKRLNITRDLRKSRETRESSESRIVY